MTRFVHLGLGAVLAAGAALAGAQDSYPERSVTLVVPTAAAGGSDTVGRLIADRLGHVLKQPFIVDNKPGANGVLGTDSIAHAKPDGYRLLFTYAAAHVVNPFLLKKMPYDVLKDFAPVVQIARGGNVLLVNPQLPVKTLKEFVDYVRARPGQLNYCSWGTGSGGHLTMESLKHQAGLVMTHAPYKGSMPCVQDIMAGQIQAGFADVSSTVGLVQAGKVRAIAISGPQRVPSFPDVPSMNEAGYPFTTYSWYGIFAPAGTPRPIVQKLNAAVQEVLKEPATIKRLQELNFSDLAQTTPEQFASVVQQDMAQWGALVRTLDLKPQ
ncbi:tripartite tricarboxylate transporter substrate binding protein [Acidovorax sp. Be4]|uniref:Tripartite tricarboxylate transporter substrate binding protein n=1 Tax=Acidovorax bellezanensis TaxID=2976702 RepID=A0ABT2PNH4_9BURK|nr:tripartite tricarboxylate transporter substrate binding protein [Acidovorax sp. Be4]MCT9810668.1 tripartite tricarboxylate transporter substrate binding protein [Acidovorax sp. Be4]